ncbi:sigma-70 family RNA polymerase sigma factor [bacterium]|nr:sigma-70 family RNA polymerase sigma factor [bacterium]
MVEPTPSIDDQFLSAVADARNGSQVALNTVLENCQNYLDWLARVQVASLPQGSLLSARDVVQETNIDAQRAIASFRGTTVGEFRAWLRQILIRNSLDAVRRVRPDHGQGRHADSHGNPGLSAIAGSGETPSRVATIEEEQQALREWVARLPEAYRRVIEMRNFEHLDFDVIAVRMNKSVDAVRKDWQRAVVMLRAKVSQP